MICNRMIPLWLKWSRFGYQNWFKRNKQLSQNNLDSSLFHPTPGDESRTSSRNSCFQCSRYWKKKFFEEFLFHKNILAFSNVTWAPRRCTLLQVLKKEIPRGSSASITWSRVHRRGDQVTFEKAKNFFWNRNSSRKFYFYHLEQVGTTRSPSYARKMNPVNPMNPNLNPNESKEFG